MAKMQAAAGSSADPYQHLLAFFGTSRKRDGGPELTGPPSRRYLYRSRDQLGGLKSGS
jgi:hypothetical protein